MNEARQACSTIIIEFISQRVAKADFKPAAVASTKEISRELSTPPENFNFAAVAVSVNLFYSFYIILTYDLLFS